jgi:predicted alpha/beta hydrolase
MAVPSDPVDAPITRDTLSLALPAGAEVPVSLYAPRAPRATVLCLPALAVPAAYYEPLALALASRGVAAATMDLRGNSASNVRPSRATDFGYADLVEDAHLAIGALRMRQGTPMYLLGHSLGGQVGALLAGHVPGVLDGLVLAACGTPYWRGFRGLHGPAVIGIAHLARATGWLLGYYPGHRLGFGGREAARLMREWGGLARRGRLEIEAFDAEAAWARARVPTLVVSIEGDSMAPRAAVDHLVGKLVSAEIERAHVARGTDGRALDHFRWARNPEAVADVVVGWLAKRPLAGGVTGP